MSDSRSLYWTLDDEELGRQYEVQITFRLRRWEPGDHITPETGGDAQLQQVAVIQARHYDGQGLVNGVDLGEAARRHDARAWRLIDSNPELHDRIESACVGVGY